MGKPPGLSFTLINGAIGMNVTRSSKALDLIWDAVREAQCELMSVQDFIREARQAWAQELKEEARYADGEFAKALKEPPRG